MNLGTSTNSEMLCRTELRTQTVPIIKHTVPKWDFSLPQHIFKHIQSHRRQGRAYGSDPIVLSCLSTNSAKFCRWIDYQHVSPVFRLYKHVLMLKCLWATPTKLRRYTHISVPHDTMRLVVFPRFDNSHQLSPNLDSSASAASITLTVLFLLLLAICFSATSLMLAFGLPNPRSLQGQKRQYRGILRYRNSSISTHLGTADSTALHRDISFNMLYYGHQGPSLQRP